VVAQVLGFLVLRFVVVAVVGSVRTVVVAAELEIQAAVAVELFAALIFAAVVGRRGSFCGLGFAVGR